MFGDADEGAAPASVAGVSSLASFAPVVDIGPLWADALVVVSR